METNWLAIGLSVLAILITIGGTVLNVRMNRAMRNMLKKQSNDTADEALV